MDDPKKTPQTAGDPAPATEPMSADQPAQAPDAAAPVTAPPAPQSAPAAPPAPQASPAPQPQQPAASAAPQQPAPSAPQQPTAPQQPSFGQQTPPPTSGTVPPPPPGTVPPQGPGTVPPPPGYQYYAAPTTAPTSSGKAIGALVCGILSILFSFAIIPGIILGIVALVLASGASKIGLRDGKITAGRVTAAIGMILSVLMLAITLIAGAFIGAVLDNSDRFETAFEQGYSDIYSDDFGYVEPFDPATATEEELAVYNVAVADADKLIAQDPQLMSAVAMGLDEEMKDMTEGYLSAQGMTFTELGVDPMELASWVLQDASYTVSDLYVYSSIGEADVTLSFAVPDDLQFATAFSTAFYAKVGELDSSSPTYLDDVKAAVAASVDDAMAATTSTVTVDVYSEAEMVGGTWALEKDWYEDLFDDYLY